MILSLWAAASDTGWSWSAASTGGGELLEWGHVLLLMVLVLVVVRRPKLIRECGPSCLRKSAETLRILSCFACGACGKDLSRITNYRYTRPNTGNQCFLHQSIINQSINQY